MEWPFLWMVTCDMALPLLGRKEWGITAEVWKEMDLCNVGPLNPGQSLLNNRVTEGARTHFLLLSLFSFHLYLIQMCPK